MAWAFIQWDTQSDVDLPAGGSHFLDHGSEQLLALVEVQAVEGGDRPLGERTDPLAQAVVLGERIPLLGKGLVLLGDAASPAIEFLGPALQLHELDQPGLVEVEQPAALGLGGLGPASQAGELGGEQLVVGCRRSGGDRAFAGQQHLGTQQRLAHLVEDEAIQRVGANVALGTAVLLTPSPQRVVVAAVVVAVAGPVTAAHLVAVDANATGAALQQPTQQPLARLGPAWAPLGVVPAHPPGGLEEVVGDDRRHGDLDPFLPRPRHLPRAAPGTGIGHGLGLVVVHPSDVGLVAQQPPEGGDAPDGLAGRRGDAIGVQAPGDLAHGVAGGDVVVEDAPHHRRLRLEDLQAGRAGGAARDPPIAVGRLPGDDLARAGPPQLAAPVALGDLGPLVFGDHALDLGEQAGLGVVVERGRVGEPHRHPVTGQLIQHDHLVGVDPGQPVG